MTQNDKYSDTSEASGRMELFVVELSCIQIDNTVIYVYKLIKRHRIITTHWATISVCNEVAVRAAERTSVIFLK